jgi:hypothetical protein
MATITVRALDENWDPLQGNGQANFLSDLDAMVQIIRSRLLLFQGEWFLDLLDGLPMFQSILGSQANTRTVAIMTSLITSRIRTTQYVMDVFDVASAYSNRSFAYAAQVQTQFGSVFVAANPNQATISFVP